MGIQDRFARILDEDEHDASEVLASGMRGWWEQLPRSSRRGVRWYTFLGSMALNKSLRAPVKTRGPGAVLHGRLRNRLDSALSNPPAFPFPVTVWRGEAHHETVSRHSDPRQALAAAEQMWPVGSTLYRPGFTSWSIAAAAAAMFSTYRRGATVVLLRTTLDRGCYITAANLATEYDVLLPRATTWRVFAVSLAFYRVAGKPWSRSRPPRPAVVVDVVPES